MTVTGAVVAPAQDAAVSKGPVPESWEDEN